MPLDITGESAYGRDWEGVAPLDLGRGETADDQQMRYALSPSAPDAPDIELRTKATIITQHFTGRFDPHGRMWSGPDHGPMEPRAYYDKMIRYVRTGNPETLWSDEAREYRKLQTDAERRDFAAAHWRKKWDDYTDPLIDRAANATEAKTVEDVLMDLRGVADTLDEQDADFVASFMENRPSGEYHDDSEFSPTDSPMGMMPDADTMAKKRAAHLERVEYDRRLEELWSKNSKTIEKQKLVDKYEARLASENQWQSYLRIRNNLTDDEAQVLDMALSAGGKARTFLGSTLTPEVKEAFMALSVESQRKVAPFLKDNAWRRDTTWVGDAVRGLARITGETIEDAGIGAAEYVRRIVVDGKEYQDGVERRALLRLANEGRMKEWGIAGDVLIDAIGNIGYMGLAAIPYAGTAMMMLSAGEQFEREAALAGADVSGWDMIGAKLAFSAAYAAVEGMQSRQIFGELTDFERRQLYANLTHHFNDKLWAKLGANVAIDTMHESIEEGIQNGIQESYVALGLDKPLPEAFCKGFVEDFMASLPSMLVTSGFGHGRRLAQYRNRPFSGPEEVLKQGIELEKVARATGERGSGAEGLAEIGRMMGFVSRDWRRAAGAAAEAGAGAAELRKAALMKYGLTEGQAVEWDAMLTQIERNIGEDKAAVQAFYGTENALTRSEIRQAGGMVETVDEATGARTLTFKDVFGTGTFSVELNAASGIDAEYAKTDEGVRSIVNALNDSRRKAPDGGAWTDEDWRALPDSDKQSILSEFRNPGLTTFRLATGETVDNRFLAALEGKMQIADNAESGDVLGVAAFHEQGHVAGRMLALAARNGDEKARELVGKLAEKFGTAKLGSEEFDEEVFGDRFRDYLVGRFDVQDGRLVRKAGALDVAADDETLFGQFVDWVRSLFARADEAVRTRTRYDEFFEQAVSGDLEGAVAADDADAGERETAEIPRSTQENAPETGAGARASIRGLFTGTAADYAQRVPVLDKDGNVTGYRIDNAPSLKHIGTGEGSQVYGWGLYASNVRGVAESYAKNNGLEIRRKGNAVRPWNDRIAGLIRNHFTSRNPVQAAIESARRNGWDQKDIESLERGEYEVVLPQSVIYEQTFFTDRAPGDESHLLKWYEPVSDEQLGWIADALQKANLPAAKIYDAIGDARRNYEAKQLLANGDVTYEEYVNSHYGTPLSGERLYELLSQELGSAKAASEFLARAGIDGVKYPVDSYGGKTVKDGDTAGWNYVSFRDDNIRVDHKWVDGVQRYSIRAGSRVTSEEDAAYMDAVSRGDMETAQEAVNRRVRELGGVFHRGKAPDATQYIVEFADDPAEIEQYGEHQFALLPDQLTDVPDFVKDFALEYFAEDNGVSVDEMSDEEKERYRNSVLPSRIRDWADAWDRADFVSALWERFSLEFEDMIDNGIVGFKTPDGAVAWPQEKAAYKIADPVTYDDAGNVIPLSERFNEANEDIRYSIRGPSMSKMDAAVAFAARDAMTGRSREDADYQRLIDALGVGKMYTPQELRKAGEAVAAAARMQGEGEPETRSWRTRMKATGNRDVNRVADTATEQARRLASHPSDMETEAVREGIRRNPTLRELAKLAEAGRHVDEAIKAAYSLGERAGVEVATEAQKAEDEMKRADEKLRQAERDAAKDEKQRDKLADLRADYQEKLRAYREKVAAKEAGERAMRQMLATQMRLHSNAENVQDLDRVLGVPAVELMAQISEVLFSGAKAPGQVREKAASGEATAEGATAGDWTAPDADAASPAGPEVRVVGTVEEASQAEAEELHDKLVRVQAIMRQLREEWRAKAEEQARKRAEREEREEAEAKPVGNDEMEAEADEGEEDSGETKEDSEPEVIETVDAAADPEMVRAMLNALKTESLDLNTSKDFATYVLAFVMDSVQQSLNMDFDAVFRNTDPIVKVKFRKTLIDFLRATSDALLDPTDDAAAKLVERRIGDIKDDASVAQLWRAAAGILGVIQRRGIQQSRRRIMRDIDKYLKRMAGSGRKLDPLAPDLSRRMTARAVQDARWLRRVLKLSNGGVIAEQNKLQHTIEERQTEGGDATDVQIDRAMRRMRLLEQFGGLRYMMPAEIKVAQHYIEDRFNAEAMELARRVEERKARTGAVADALIAAADATREALGGFDAEDGKGMSARGRRLLDSLAGGSLRQRLQHLTGDDPAARRAVDEIVRMVFEGETQHRLLEQRFKREHDAILQFAAAAGGIDQRTLLRQLDENVPDDLSRALATPEQNRRLKWGQALQLLVSLEQTASYGDNIALHFRGDKDANGNPQTPHSKLILDAMADKPQFQALINKLRETYRDRRGMISEVMERVTGLPVLSPDPLFMPVKMKSAPREGLDMKVKSWTPWNAIFSPRVKNNLDFDTSADIMGMFDERSRETAKSVAFAETGLDLRSILGRKETQTAFIRARGAFFNTRLIEQVTDALNSGYTTPSNDLINILRPLGTACTYASLSWNVVTMLKQMTSIPAWTAVLDGGYGELFRAMSSIDGESIREFMDAPGFRSRYGVENGGWGTFAKIIGDAFRDPSRSYIQRFYNAGMTLVQFGDFVPSFLIGPGVYKARKAALMRQNPGMTEEAAKAQALSDAWSLVEQCQQSDLQENLPDILRRQGVVAKQVMKFCNSPLMQVAHEVQSARMWADAARRAKAGEAGAKETADKWRGRFVNQIVCNHIIMPAAMYAAELLVKAALGNEPPDKDEVMGRIVAQMLLGSWGKVFILGVILDKVTTGASVGAGKATGLYNYKPTAYMSSGGSPAGIQLVEQFVSDMGRLGSDIAYTDWESLRDDSVRMLARSARPVKYGTDIAYNYGGADRAKERAARRRAIRKEREKAAGE